MNFTFKNQGGGQAVSRFCSILLSLSFLILCSAAVFTFEKAVQFTAEAKYEEEVAEVIGANLQTLVNGVAEHFEEDFPYQKSSNVSAPSPLHLGVGKNFKVTVAADGKRKAYSVNSGTVSDILKKAGVKVGEYDILNHELQDALRPNMTVRVRRVTFSLETQTVMIKYKTKKKKTSELYLGEMYVEKAGENGEREDTYINVYIDGEFEKHSLICSETKKEAVNEVIFTGTKKRVVKLDSVGTVGYSGLRAVSELPSKVRIELDEYGKPTKYKQKIVGSATAYYGGGITSTGQRAMPGRVAVDPREIPYGSKLYIVSCDGTCVYGYCEASDTGGFIYNSPTVVDLYFNTYDECVRFGRRNVEIYVLE